ncbi:MAG: efflux RND transporter periplasmic adaptor subunit [Bacteroidaceae bacterium]|nr:efflux RND transporter periplasmic adaptor subunit [Bacteroidaceae bacterium]
MKHVAKLLLISLLVACEGGIFDSDKVIDVEQRTIVETGELSAVRTKAFVMPRFGRFGSFRIIGLAEHGKVIQTGDSVIQLDPADVTKYIVDRETALESQLASLEKMLVNQENRDSQAESTIKSELATYELRKLTYEAAQFESERTKRIKELEFQQATIQLNLAKRRLELNAIINENDLKIQQIRVEQIKKDIQDAYDIIPQLTIRSTIPGIFQITRNHRTGQLLKIGDEVWRGNTMASVPDLSWMKVETQINENDFLRIKEGDTVLVRLDALPEVAFEGRIADIGLFCHPKDYNKPRQKVFDVEVRLLVSDERLKPGMTVSCEFLPNNNI